MENPPATQEDKLNGLNPLKWSTGYQIAGILAIGIVLIAFGRR